MAGTVEAIIGVSNFASLQCLQMSTNVYSRRLEAMASRLEAFAVD